MSLGAITSAPARACETAVRASSSSVASLSTLPSGRTTPQWPWLVYSHRHRSVITIRSGMGLLDRPRRQLHDALVVPGARALLVLGGGEPEQQHGGDPELRRLARLGDRVGDREPVDAGHRRDRLAPVDPVGDEHRVDEVRGGQLRLADQAAQRVGGAQPAQAGLREGHRSEDTGGAGARTSRDSDQPQTSVPGLDPPARHEPGLDIWVGLRERLDLLWLDAAEDDRRTGAAADLRAGRAITIRPASFPAAIAFRCASRYGPRRSSMSST